MQSVELRACSSHVVLRLRGEIDAVSASDAVAAMTTIMPAGRCVIVDLAELEFADCAALNGLREVQNLARQGGGDMLLAEPSGIVLRLLTLTERFAICASVAAAVATCEDSPRCETGRPAVSPAAPGKTSPLSTAA